MNLKELSSPVRAYWDLSPEPREKTVDYGRICDELADIRILSLSLWDRGDTLTPACREVLRRMQDRQMAVSLTMPLRAASDRTLSDLSSFRLRRLYLETSSLEEIRTSRILPEPGSTPISSGISFVVGHSNRGELPGLVAFCLAKGIRHLVFPMERIGKGSGCFYLTEEELLDTAAGLKGMQTAELVCEIHDPFLWRIFYPDQPFPEAGCQAANSMIHISADGSVYPCPSLQVMLGNIHESRLRDILGTEAKKRLREDLSRPPGECDGCEESAACLGGCRGRGYAVTGSLDSRDPGCSMK